MEAGLGPGDFVLDGKPAPPKGEQLPKFSAHVYCSQTARWIKMPLGTEVGLGAGDLVLDGAKLLPLKGAQPQFRPMSVVAKQLDGSRCHLVRRHRPRLSAGDIVLDGSLAPP